MRDATSRSTHIAREEQMMDDFPVRQLIIRGNPLELESTFGLRRSRELHPAEDLQEEDEHGLVENNMPLLFKGRKDIPKIGFTRKSSSGNLSRIEKASEKA